MKLTATSVAWVFAASFYAAAAIGFIPNPLLGPHGLFVANTAHNTVHLLTGVTFTVVALVGSKASVVFMQAFGLIYLLTGVIASWQPDLAATVTCSAWSISTPWTTSSTWALVP